MTGMASQELLPLLSPRHLPTSRKRCDSVVMALPYTFLITIVVFLISVPYVWANPLPRQSLPRTKPNARFQDRLGAVASESNICSQIGIDLLKKGGNAADAVGFPSKSFFLSIRIDAMIARWDGLLRWSDWHVP
jgi:hypothetical protein